MVLSMTNNKRIDVELLEGIMQYLEERASVRQSAVTSDDDFSNQTSPDSLVYSVNKSANTEQTAGKLGENEHLVEFLGKILQQVSNTFMIVTMFYYLFSLQRVIPNSFMWGVNNRLLI